MCESKDFTIEAIARVLGFSRASACRHLHAARQAGLGGSRRGDCLTEGGGSPGCGTGSPPRRGSHRLARDDVGR
ncbi:MAG: hypothetical protein ACYCZN_02615 [Candidatus Dormibacteria bacterium]